MEALPTGLEKIFPGLRSLSTPGDFHVAWGKCKCSTSRWYLIKRSTQKFSVSQLSVLARLFLPNVYSLDVYQLTTLMEVTLLGTKVQKIYLILKVEILMQIYTTSILNL